MAEPFLTVLAQAVGAVVRKIAQAITMRTFKSLSSRTETSEPGMSAFRESVGKTPTPCVRSGFQQALSF